MKQLAKYETDTRNITGRMQTRCDRQDLSKTVRMILGRYNQKPQGDADLYVRQMTALLADYPAEVVQKFASPVTDPLPASDFLPSVATVRDAADKLLAIMQREEDLYRRYSAPLLPEPDTGPTPEERNEIGDKMQGVVDSMKVTAKQREAQKLPEWLLDEADQSAAHKRISERLSQSQCKPGEAIRAHLAKAEPIKDA